MSRPTKKPNVASITTRRKRATKNAQARFPGRPLAYLGGVLHFMDAEPPVRVPDTPVILREGAEDTGLAAARKNGCRAVPHSPVIVKGNRRSVSPKRQTTTSAPRKDPFSDSFRDPWASRYSGEVGDVFGSRW